MIGGTGTLAKFNRSVAPPRVIETGETSQAHQPTLQILRKDSDYRLYQQWTGKPRRGFFKSSPIDFNHRIGVAIFLGERPQGNSKIQFLGLEKRDGVVVPTFREVVLEAGCGVASKPGQPYLLVSIPWTAMRLDPQVLSEVVPIACD